MYLLFIPNIRLMQMKRIIGIMSCANINLLIFTNLHIYLLSIKCMLTLCEMRGVVVDIGEADVYCGAAC